MAIQEIGPSQAKIGQNQFTAQILVNNLPESIAFYQKAFGFKKAEKQHAGQPSSQDSKETCIMECNGLPILLVSEKASRSVKGYQAKSPSSLNLYSSTVITVLCKNIQRLYEQAINAGAKPIQAPHKTGAGAITFLVAGPENYVWRFIDNFSDLSQIMK